MDADLGKRRPVYLNLLKIHMPVMAVVSIAHRLSGVALFLAMPLCVWVLEYSLSGPDSFAEVGQWLARTDIRLFLLLLVWGLALHFFAGLRFLVIDLGAWVELSAARASAWAVHALALMTVLSVASGWWL